MLKIWIGIVVAMALIIALQTYRLGKCQVKAKNLDVCLEVDELEKDARDATDDELIDSISQP